MPTTAAVYYVDSYYINSAASYWTTNSSTTSVTGNLWEDNSATGSTTGSTLTRHLGDRRITINATGNVWVVESVDSAWSSYTPPPESRRSRMRRRFFEQLHPLLKNHQGNEPRALRDPITEERLTAAEIVALGTLKDHLTYDQWRTYLRRSVVTVEGASGLSYVVPRGGERIRVLGPRGAFLCTLCLHVNGRVPPSDEVLARVLMVRCDEPEIWRRSNVQGKETVHAGYPWSAAALDGLRRGQPLPAIRPSC